MTPEPALTEGLGPLGIIAGGGALPGQIADLARASGRGVHIVGLTGEAGPAIEQYPHTWVNWASIGRMMRALREAGCRDIIFVGGVTRPDLARVWRVRPDLGMLRALPTVFGLFGGGDDHVLRRIVRFFEAQGFCVRGVADVAPELVVGDGPQGVTTPSHTALADAACGFALIDALGFADVGQAVVVRGGQILAIEAAEGTDRMLERLAGAANGAGGVLAKGPKPGQELRIDLPAIGPRTIEGAAKSGLAGIAVAAGRVLAADREKLIRLADTAGLFVTGVVRPLATVPSRRVVALRSLTRMQLGKHLRRDMARAINVMAALRGFGASGGVAVVRRYVVAIETGEGIDAMLARAGLLRSERAAHRRRGGAVAVGQLSCATVEDTIAAVAAAGFAGVVLPGDATADVVDRAAAIAASQGLAIAVDGGDWRRTAA